MCRKMIYGICLMAVCALLAQAASGALVAYYPMNEGEGTVITDASGSGHDGTVQGGQAVWTEGPPGFGKALFWDGSNPAKFWVHCGTWNPSAETGQITVAYWIKWSGANGVWQGIVAKRDDWDPASAPPMMWYMESAQNTGTIGFQTRDVYPPSAPAPPVGVWTHVAAAFDGTTVRIYINGEEKASGNFRFGAKTDAAILIGCDSISGYNGFNGAIDEVRIYDTALSPAEIARLMSPVAFNSWGPSPKDGATDVPRDTRLSWSPGQYAASHDVYLGLIKEDVAAATRANPMGLLLSQGQAGTIFTLPAPLDFGQTYYWRVDEVNAPPDSTIHKGDVWTFKVEPYAYAVRPIAATASSQHSSSTGPGKTIDGSGLNPATDEHDVALVNMWLSAKTGPVPVWIQYEFDKAYMLNQLWVWNSNQMIEDTVGYGAKDVTIEYSTDGQTWTALPGVFEFAQATGMPDYTANTKINLGNIVAKYVKLTIQKAWSGSDRQASLAEVRFFYVPLQARDPQPASGASNVALDATLNWRPGRKAATHKVFMGTDQALVQSEAVQPLTVTDHQIDLANKGLEYATTYYWKVNEVNGSDVWPGDVWSFSTVQYTTVENFDAYDDKCQRIFYTWIDGFGHSGSAECGVAPSSGNATGSTVGNFSPPYAERVIVYAGKQSMPLSFDNTKSPFYSQTERSWQNPQVWSGAGLNTLTLYLRGDPAAFMETSPGTFIMNGTGTDIWDTSDQFRFAYKTLNGDGSIVARVDSITNTHVWAKAGVMIRQTLESASTHAMVVVTPGSGVSFQRRLETGAVSYNTDAAGLRAPYWVKLVRTGNRFTGYRSPDGQTWTEIVPTTPVDIAMGQTVYIGLAVTSHAQGAVCGAKFSNVSTTGSVTGTWQVAEIGAAQAQGNTPENFYVSITDSSGKSATISHPDPSVIATGNWEQWDIPLAELTSKGVNLKAVKAMAIGVGNPSSPKPGGQGKLYIDEIRLTKR